MKTSTLSNFHKKIEELEKTMVEVWDHLSPSQKERRSNFERFLVVQTKTRLLKQKIEKELNYEISSR